jgi:DNA-binding NarL/FixJ family response regulator
MKGGTLLVSREINNHAYFKRRFEALGFPDVTVTALNRDGLNFLIRDIKPKFLIMGARFYQCCTPFFMGELKRRFKKIKMAAVCIGEYPPELAMYFNINGGNSYVSSFDGFEQLYKGLEEIKNGREYVSPEVVERLNLRREFPKPAGNITERQKQVMRLICCGFRDIDIANNMAVTKSTVENYKTAIYTSLNVTNNIELIRSVLTLEIVKLDELYFYPDDFTVNPKPDAEKLREMKNSKLAHNKRLLLKK